MPVLFTSHGNPFDIVKSREERPFWKTLHDLGKSLRAAHDIRAVVVVSAHWITTGVTKVNVSSVQEQLYDYYGFPAAYYAVEYRAQGSPQVAREVAAALPGVRESNEWGLDHGAWPMLMHLFPEADVPVFQLSIDYHASPRYHYELGRQLRTLRDRGVLIVGSGSMIHNLRLAMGKMRTGDHSPFGWEADYDAWLKEQLDHRRVDKLIDYERSHPLGKVASPTPDHFVPLLYSLGLMDKEDELRYFYDETPDIPAFSERSFLLQRA